MRFELVKVQVIDSQSTVRNTDTPLTGTLSMAPQYPYEQNVKKQCFS